MRVQILPLPTLMNGDHLEEPFALIIDRCPADAFDELNEQGKQFKESAGARALLVTSDTVELVDPYSAQVPPAVKPKIGPEPEPPARSPYAVNAIMFDKRIVIDWPDGPPSGVGPRDARGRWKASRRPSSNTWRARTRRRARDPPAGNRRDREP